MESILQSIKSLLGANVCQNYFDDAILTNINMAISTIAQLDVGIQPGFEVLGDSETWEDVTTDTVIKGFLKTYVYLKVKMVFDPPVSSFVLQSMEKQASELEWRINEHYTNEYGGIRECT